MSVIGFKVIHSGGSRINCFDPPHPTVIRMKLEWLKTLSLIFTPPEPNSLLSQAIIECLA